MYGERFSSSYTRLIEAKEGVPVRSESKTLTTITLQNYFRMSQKLSGMTGYCQNREEDGEISTIWTLLSIPTNKPIARTDPKTRLRVCPSD